VNVRTEPLQVLLCPMAQKDVAEVIQELKAFRRGNKQLG
jgi:hypothetical protein